MKMNETQDKKANDLYGQNLDPHSTTL